MKFIRDLLNRKSQNEPAPVEETEAVTPDLKAELPEVEAGSDTEPQEDLAAQANLSVVPATDDGAAPTPDAESVESADDKSSDEILEKINAQVSDESSVIAPVNIWDMDGDDAAAPEAAQQEAASPARRRRRRNQTRVLGFDSSATDNVSEFEKAEKVAPTMRAKFPVGLVMVADGPGRGECFTLEAGMSQIGRADDQAIQLDFGDSSISRVNHAAIVYDIESHSYMLGHGGKKNIVRLNGTPVISNETIKTGDEIKIGETTLRFIGLCDEEFNWAGDTNNAEEQDDVAIA